MAEKSRPPQDQVFHLRTEMKREQSGSGAKGNKRKQDEVAITCGNSWSVSKISYRYLATHSVICHNGVFVG
jgi:hypothetical protein